MKEELKEEKKKRTGLTIVVGLLVLVIIAMGVYIAYDKGYISLGKKEKKTTEKKIDNNDKNETKKSEAEELDIESSEVEELYYNANNHLGVGIDKNIYNKNELTVEDMDKNYKFSLAYNAFKNDIIVKNEGQYTIETISEEKVKEGYENSVRFGEEFYYDLMVTNQNQNEGIYENVNQNQNDEFKLYCSNFKYNESKKVYESITGGCGGTTAFSEIDTILSATKYEDRIEIVSGVVFIDAETTAMYKDFNKKTKIKDLTEDEMTNTLGNTWESKFTSFIKDNPDKVSKYTYTFKIDKDGSTYYTGVKNTK